MEKDLLKHKGSRLLTVLKKIETSILKINIINRYIFPSDFILDDGKSIENTIFYFVLLLKKYVLLHVKKNVTIDV